MGLWPDRIRPKMTIRSDLLLDKKVPSKALKSGLLVTSEYLCLSFNKR